MSLSLYAPPKRGQGWQYSVVLNDLSKKHGKRVLALFERRSFEYSGHLGRPSDYTTWRRRETKRCPLPA